MNEHIFPKFLKDPQEYGQAERFWQDTWRQLLQQARQMEYWETPWLSTSFADGSPCLDGNPIFSAVRRDWRVGVRVLQLDPLEAPGEFTYWFDVFAEGEPEEVRELVICCALTERNLSKAVDLMRWVGRSAEDVLPRAKLG